MFRFRLSLPCLLAAICTLPVDAFAQLSERDQQRSWEIAAQVDRVISTDLKAQGVPIAEPASDEDFLRRVSLDLTGQLPSPLQVTLFTLDPSPDKRAKLIGRLLDSEAYAENWSRYWRDVIYSRVTEVRALLGRNAFEEWMTEQLDSGAGWDEIATAMITATGDVRENGATAILSAHGAEAPAVTAEVSRVFMGIQIQCAECHDHTTDRWKREDFHQMAAYFPRIRLRPKRMDNGRSFEIVSQDSARSRGNFLASNPQFVLRRLDRNRDGKLTKAEVANSPLSRVFDRLLQFGDSNKDGGLTLAELKALPMPMMQGNQDIEHYMPNLNDPGSKGDLMQPVFLASTDQSPNGRDLDRRAEFARLMTSPNNPWFARAVVNRLWAELLGEGFYMPIDDMGPDRQPLYGEALDALSHGFVESGHDLRWLLATIASTDAYQRAARARTIDSASFASATATRLRSDQIFDSLATVLNLDLEANSSRAPRGGGYRGRFGPRTQFNAVFTFDPSTPQEDITGTVPQALFLMNSPLVNGQIQATGSTRLANLLREYPGNDDALRELYLLVLSREPSARELKICNAHIAKTGDRNTAFEDLMWSLLNSSEFVSKR